MSRAQSCLGRFVVGDRAPKARTRPVPPAAAPFTNDDFAGSRRLTARPGSWQNLDPLRPAAAGAAAPIVGSSASFIADLAGTQTLLSDASLREVSSEGPRGVSYGLARPLAGEPVSTPSPVEQAPDAAISAEQYATQDVTRRPVVASGPPTHADLTSYVGELHPAEPEPYELDEEYGEPFGAEDDVREELPPPIFSSLLAERTGRDLSELRPDLAGAADDGMLSEDEDASLSPAEAASASARRHSLAESRRLGLGAPLPSRPVDVGHHERVEPPDGPEPIVFELREPEPEPVAPPSPEPPRRAVADYRSAHVPPAVRSDVARALGAIPVPSASVATKKRRTSWRASARVPSRVPARCSCRWKRGHSKRRRRVPSSRTSSRTSCNTACYGGNLPRTSSAEGRRLEAEAHAVERYVRGDDPVPRIAPVRTLRATAGDPRIDSGGFVRSVTEQLVAVWCGPVGRRRLAGVPATGRCRRGVAGTDRRPEQWSADRDGRRLPSDLGVRIVARRIVERGRRSPRERPSPAVRAWLAQRSRSGRRSRRGRRPRVLAIRAEPECQCRRANRTSGVRAPPEVRERPGRRQRPARDQPRERRSRDRVRPHVELVRVL